MTDPLNLKPLTISEVCEKIAAIKPIVQNPFEPLFWRVFIPKDQLEELKYDIQISLVEALPQLSKDEQDELLNDSEFRSTNSESITLLTTYIGIVLLKEGPEFNIRQVLQGDEEIDQMLGWDQDNENENDSDY